MCVIASPLELGVSGYFESFQTAHGRFPRSLINLNIPPPSFHFIRALEKRNTKLLSSASLFCDHEPHKSRSDTGRADSFPWTLILQVSSDQSQLQVTILSRNGFLAPSRSPRSHNVRPCGTKLSRAVNIHHSGSNLQAISQE